jgi:hypothetical protein
MARGGTAVEAVMKIRHMAVVAAIALASGGCVPDWASQSDAPYILEIASITNADGTLPILSDVSFPVVNDNATVTVNIFRKNNNDSLGTSAVEHVYLKRYEVRYFRTDGRNTEGVDVPHRVSGALGNIRLHTPAAGEEIEAQVNLVIVRHQAKIEPPLKNLQGGVLGDTNLGVLPQGFVLTMIAEVTIHGETVQGRAMEAKGFVDVSFADFPDSQ